MTPELQKRIEQIQRGEVPEGYKKTKVGIVPAEWEITRFKKKFDRLMRKNTEGNTNVLTISAQFGLVNQEEFFNKSVASDDKSNYYFLFRGEFAYNKSYSNGYPFGAIKRLDNYDTGIVSPLYICFSASEGNECPEFYLQYFEAGRMNSEIHAFAQEGARNHGLLNISVEDFFNSFLAEPPLPEQKKIAEILATQDQVIELCEKKVEQLKKLKKAFMQKMFPKPGCNVPEWRFQGFTEAWKQHQFANFTHHSAKRNKSGIDYPPYAITNEFGFVPQNEAHEDFGYMKDTDRTAYLIVTPNSFAYNPARINVGSIGYYNGIENVIVSSLYEVFQTVDSVNDRFLWHWFKSDLFPKWIYRLQEGSVRMYFYYDKLCECKVHLPSFEEQKKIADCLDELDSGISLHQRKCDEEKQKKKALMQLLLTGIVRVRT